MSGYETVDGMSVTGAQDVLRTHNILPPYTLPRLSAALLSRGWSAETVLDADGLWVAVCVPHPEQPGERVAIGYVQVEHLSVPTALTQAFAIALRDWQGAA